LSFETLEATIQTATRRRGTTHPQPRVFYAPKSPSAQQGPLRPKPQKLVTSFNIRPLTRFFDPHFRCPNRPIVPEFSCTGPRVAGTIGELPGLRRCPSAAFRIPHAINAAAPSYPDLVGRSCEINHCTAPHPDSLLQRRFDFCCSAHGLFILLPYNSVYNSGRPKALVRPRHRRDEQRNHLRHWIAYIPIRLCSRKSVLHCHLCFEHSLLGPQRNSCTADSATQFSGNARSISCHATRSAKRSACITAEPRGNLPRLQRQLPRRNSQRPQLIRWYVLNSKTTKATVMSE
jgi:hypothetical protein